MRFSYLASLALLASFTAFGAGCAASSDSAESEPTAQGTPEALSSAAPALSQPLVCAAISAAVDATNSQGEGLKAIPEAKLKGDALRDFKSWQRPMLPDYPSQAWELPVKLGTKTYTFILVTESNDGGDSEGLYRTDGSVVTTDQNSESEENPWSSPGDTCDTSN